MNQVDEIFIQTARMVTIINFNECNQSFLFIVETSLSVNLKIEYQIILKLLMHL